MQKGGFYLTERSVFEEKNGMVKTSSRCKKLKRDIQSLQLK